MAANTGDTETFEAIILTAGRSERMGAPKALLVYNHITLLEACLENYSTAHAQKIIVVCNQKLAMSDVFNAIILRFPRARVTINRGADEGRHTSVLCGLNALTKGAHALIQNIDNPAPHPSEIISMLTALPNAGCCVVPNIAGKNAHPVLLGHRVAQHLRKTPDSKESLRTLMAQFPRRILPMQNQLLTLNLNTPADFARYTRFLTSAHAV
jgi:molybdenum cofactor cytidylyltransferase